MFAATRVERAIARRELTRGAASPRLIRPGRTHARATATRARRRRARASDARGRRHAVGSRGARRARARVERGARGGAIAR